MPSRPHFFSSRSAWRAWLEEHHAESKELWVGLYKKKSGRPSITWPEAVDGALCFGWIDGLRKSVNATSYKIRFTPRKPRSVWSAVNIKRATELSAMGSMHSAGLLAFQKREAKQSEIYSYEQRKVAKLPAAYEKEFRAHPAAGKFFRAQAPWYQRTAIWWVISAKKEETRLKRLAVLIEDSEHQRTIRALMRQPPPQSE
ncbi:MAG TPA: YdeI/OmpD-associated family protein [Candidatus Polarisedimenticolia bacterium]|nr:YdeI/OmpD-associated family protein [Candidatus Polarisedimenticolia bacterium]